MNPDTDPNPQMWWEASELFKPKLDFSIPLCLVTMFPCMQVSFFPCIDALDVPHMTKYNDLKIWKFSLDGSSTSWQGFGSGSVSRSGSALI